MKTIIKTLTGIAAFFGAILGWHAIMPLSICWLTETQIAACIGFTVANIALALIFFIEAE